jgi:HEAT repeat protein
LVTLIAAGYGKSIDYWKEQMKSPDSAFRLRAIHALRERGTEPAVVQVLAEAVKDEDTFVRRDAARALGNARSATEAVSRLEALLNDKEPSVRKAAADSIKKINANATR